MGRERERQREPEPEMTSSRGIFRMKFNEHKKSATTQYTEQIARYHCIVAITKTMNSKVPSACQKAWANRQKKEKIKLSKVRKVWMPNRSVKRTGPLSWTNEKGFPHSSWQIYNDKPPITA
jgi:hypothetical protein